MAVDTANMISNAALATDLSKSIETKKRLASPLSTPERIVKVSKTEERSPLPHKPEEISGWIDAYEVEHKPMDGMKMAQALLDLDLQPAKEELTGGKAGSHELLNSVGDLTEKLKRSERSAKAYLATNRTSLAGGETWDFMKDEERFKVTYAIARDVLTCLYYKPELCLRNNDCRGYDFKDGEKRELCKPDETSKYHAVGERSKYGRNGIYNEDRYEGLIHVIREFNAGVGYDRGAENDMILFLEMSFPPLDIRDRFEDAKAGTQLVAAYKRSLIEKREFHDIVRSMLTHESERRGLKSMIMASALLAQDNGHGTSYGALMEKMKRSMESAKQFLWRYHDTFVEGFCDANEDRLRDAYGCLLDIMTCLYYKPEIIIDEIEKLVIEAKDLEYDSIEEMPIDECGGRYIGAIITLQEDYGLPDYDNVVDEDMMIMWPEIDFPPPGIVPEKDGKAVDHGEEGDGTTEVDSVDEAEKGAKEDEDDE